MGNSESSPHESYENYPDQPNSNVGDTVGTRNRPQSPEHARSSTQTSHQHHPQAHTGASVNFNNKKNRHTGYIADNYDSLEEVHICFNCHSLNFISTVVNNNNANNLVYV